MKRIRETHENPTHGVVLHPGILYLSEVAAAVKRGAAAIQAAMDHNNPYLSGLTVEEGREIAKIVNVLRQL